MQPPGSGYGNLPVWQLIAAPSNPTAGTGSTGGSVATGNIDAGVPSLPDYSQIDNLIAQINATNQAAQHAANLGRIPGAEDLEAQSSQNIAGLLNPPTQFGEIDVPAASAAVASGTVGSPFAGITGLNLSETERLRRQAMGQAQLNAAYERNPAAPIADPQALAHLLQTEGFTADQSAAQRALQLRLAQMEQETALAIAAMRRSGSYGTGGGGGYSPRFSLPNASPSTTPFGANIPGSIVPTGWDVPGIGPGEGEAFGIPGSALPENWTDLPFDLQADYAAMINANPYYNTPDQYNPYAAEYNPDVSLGAF